jgi:hypothetical protein
LLAFELLMGNLAADQAGEANDGLLGFRRGRLPLGGGRVYRRGTSSDRLVGGSVPLVLSFLPGHSGLQWEAEQVDQIGTENYGKNLGRTGQVWRLRVSA